MPYLASPLSPWAASWHPVVVSVYVLAHAIFKGPAEQRMFRDRPALTLWDAAERFHAGARIGGVALEFPPGWNRVGRNQDSTEGSRNLPLVPGAPSCRLFGVSVPPPDLSLVQQELSPPPALWELSYTYGSLSSAPLSIGYIQDACSIRNVWA
ncbi:hypothetical protein PpBr36_04242 [Pyricularia pennisetigena]|uniref:hypothetical protein n=1 Tax=Pyricularia pennisetigena TaxID=1578925 RepID=UPI00115276F1|nr:hypothetical protein PpBr36_04242 [Pyricularia pennisetigena]TLS26431.1 hypothetical protein PpBr36_04242 [Pyricularia pennisetigena]